ncbi:MAG: xanthine dehydrogenase family protein subunit M [Chloroflexi bacterium]|nr:xanthine dehydrogenase family protein subunit M [Chloroflexota bacterium]
MTSFDYVVARSIDDVTSLLNRDGMRAGILAGGTDLLVQLREHRRALDLVIDVKHIPELNTLAYDPASGLTIGAAVSCLRICGDADAQNRYPGLVDAVKLIGGTQIQGRATLGGNLVNASPAADSIPALIVHQAVVDIAGPHGRRSVPVESFCTAPGRTVLQAGEFVVSLRIPPPVAGFGAHYQRFIPRNEMDIAVVGAGAAVWLSPDGSRFERVRVALAAVAPVPLYIPEIGERLSGQPVSDALVDEAGRIAASAARPISDVRGTAEQRTHLSAVLTRRALTAAIARARQPLAEG